MARAFGYQVPAYSAPLKSLQTEAAPQLPSTALVEVQVSGSKVALTRICTVLGRIAAPDGRGLLEHVETLLADGGAAVAAHRHGRRRIVEALVGGVVVDDGDGRRLRGRRQADEREHRKEPAQPQKDAGRHGYLSSQTGVGAGARGSSRRSRAWASFTLRK